MIINSKNFIQLLKCLNQCLNLGLEITVNTNSGTLWRQSHDRKEGKLVEIAQLLGPQL